jgi:hypothetical protein
VLTKLLENLDVLARVETDNEENEDPNPDGGTTSRIYIGQEIY